MTHYERKEQIAFVNYIKISMPDVYKMMCASANGEKRPINIFGKKRYCASGKTLKDMGVKKGYPDISIFIPAKGYHGLFIEMKRTGKLSKITKEQKDWVKNLNENGYFAKICYGCIDAINTVYEYFDIKKRIGEKNA